MADIIKKSAFVILLALLLLGCGAFDKKLYLYVPEAIDEGVADYNCSVTVAQPVLSTVSIQLSVSVNGKERIALDKGGLEITEDGVTATFLLTAINDGIAGNDATATITATAAGYTSDSADITIYSPP